MMRIERLTGLGCNSQRLHQKEIGMIVLIVEYQEGGQDEDPDPARKGSR